ncbi:hypothetical protein IMSHALPRED_006775 [Imshaugia aleurites]|uniref:Uncharacterized protein n=1 Tax=Imshaugia aleurites TaxID=172621 RepID=A0A8H3FMV1_9LECA|nr:hypothetical protein IMSHALPRED_006775 [Imshaugia aleurites]
MAQTGEAWTYTNEGFVNVSNTGGAICDYVRTNHVESLTEQIAGPADAASMPKMAVANEHSARAYDRTAMKMEGESGRVSRHNGAVTAICEDDGEDDDFWKARCDDVDCIYVGEHCRYQCATAEVDEEPHHKALFPKRGLRFRPWAT